MACTFDCSAVNFSSTDCNYLAAGRFAQCGPNITQALDELYFDSTQTNCTTDLPVNYERGLTAALIFTISFIGNICTIILLSRFKVHKIPDVLVIGLAVTDMVATLIPLPLSLWAYFTGYRFMHGEVLCDLFATLAHFTRYASVLIVTIVAVERYLAVIHPFFYRKHATPKKVALILVVCWLVAFALAVAPALDRCTSILPHEGYCLFDVYSNYAISILVYGVIQYVIVFFCFIAVSVQLAIVYRRRKKLKVQGKYNKQSKAQERQQEVKFVKPNLTSRISDLSKSLRKAAPAVAEKFAFGVEAQFARMLFAVVVLFYLSWTAILVIIVVAFAQDTSNGLETALFWGIRMSVISTALNPLLYGILARQYRLAYWYVIKLALSKCCKCVNPPLKDVFAAARAPGGDIRSNTSVAGNRRKRFKQNGSVGRQSQPESIWSRGTGGAVLTGTTTHTLVTHKEDLEAIDEADLMLSPDSIIEEHSTYVPSAGELASSVIIPLQVRDKSGSDADISRTLRMTASLDNLDDGMVADFGYTQDAQPGVDNPMVNVLAEGEELSSSEQGSAIAMEDGFHVGRLYQNPVYQIELARRQRESHTMSSLVAASSADDITLVSKVPIHEPTVTSPLATSTAKLQDGPHGNQPATDNSQVSTEHAQEAEQVKNNKKRPEDKRLEQMRKLQMKAISRSQEFDVVAAGTNHRRNSLNIEPLTTEEGVHTLRMKFEPPTVTTTLLPPPISPPTRNAPSQPNGKGGRCNSVGNSDSGRESMVLETDV